MSGLASAARALRDLGPDRRFGKVVAVRGALIEVAGLAGATQIGSRIEVMTEAGAVEAEVTGLDHDVAHCLPFSDPQGVASGARADLVADRFALRPTESWLGRMIDGLGRPADGKGPLARGPVARPIKALPPPPLRGAGLGRSSTRASAHWTSSRRFAAANGSACLQDRASESPSCSRCWLAGQAVTSR